MQDPALPQMIRFEDGRRAADAGLEPLATKV